MRDRAEGTHADQAIMRAVTSLPAGRYLLAVSGGRDSMVLLDAFVRSRSDAVALATFDHRTGSAAAEAARLVEVEGAQRGIPVVTGRMPSGVPSGESGWRAARWRFLHGAAAGANAAVVTAHTRDDQVETVIIRALRDAGPRGLAAMYADSPVARPLLGVSRSQLTRYAVDRGIRHVEDPSNRDLRFLRNRVRHELLPALERVRPGFGAEMLEVAARSAKWRADVDTLVDGLGVATLPPGRSLMVPVASIREMDAAALAVVWPSIAGRAGVRLDWRGTERLVAFTMNGRPGGRIPLSGGVTVRRTPTSFVLGAFGVNEALYSIV